MKKFELPVLPYAYDALEPIISKKTMELHHTKNHQAYVNGANAALEKLEKFRKGEMEIDMKATLRDLSFNLSGHILHSIFWPNMIPVGKGGSPSGKILNQINKDFGSVDAFKKEFTAAAKTCEGNGWAALAYDHWSEQFFVMQIEKHNLATIAGLKPLLVLDLWEHGWTMDYPADRPKYIENWWQLVNWNDAEDRFNKIL